MRTAPSARAVFTRNDFAELRVEGGISGAPQEPRLRPARLALLGLMLLAGSQPVAAQSPQVDEPATTIEADEPRPGPPPPLPDLSEPNGRAGEALNEPGERSGIPKALRGSGSKAGGPANDLNPGGRAEAPAPPRGEIGQVIAGQALFHGNYCGKGQRGEGLPPTDDLDAACMRHDACYDAAGYSSCACDATLRREAASVADGTNASLEVRRRALSVIEAAAAMACRAP
ncbi:hypothetical protein FOHLNKBM_3867 [Methylobacterium longum]|nr:hypothetical protein FOHLNKBM_3867 [Methylobacterium longum]